MLLLRLHQIEYLQDGQLPSDLSGALLFSNTELDKLKHRVHVSVCCLCDFGALCSLPQKQDKLSVLDKEQ